MFLLILKRKIWNSQITRKFQHLSPKLYNRIYFYLMNSTNVFLKGIHTYLILHNVNSPIAINVFIHDM